MTDDVRGWEGAGSREPDEPGDDAAWGWAARAYAATPPADPRAAHRAAARVASEVRARHAGRARRRAAAAGVAACLAAGLVAIATWRHDATSPTAPTPDRPAGAPLDARAEPAIPAPSPGAPTVASTAPTPGAPRPPAPSAARPTGAPGTSGATVRDVATAPPFTPVSGPPVGATAPAAGDAPSYAPAFATLRTLMADSSLSQLRALVSAATGRGLPAAPLLDRAMQGARRGAGDAAVLTAVRAVTARLATAREALGAQSSDAELTAGAEALLSGATPETLGRVRAGRGPGKAVVPLVVLTDLVSSGVAPDEAAAALTTLLRPGVGAPATDEAMLALRAEVAADVARGAAPAAALRSRVGSRPPGPSGPSATPPTGPPPAPSRLPGVRPDQPITGVP